MSILGQDFRCHVCSKRLPYDRSGWIFHCGNYACSLECVRKYNKSHGIEMPFVSEKSEKVEETKKSYHNNNLSLFDSIPKINCGDTVFWSLTDGMINSRYIKLWKQVFDDDGRLVEGAVHIFMDGEGWQVYTFDRGW